MWKLLLAIGIIISNAKWLLKVGEEKQKWCGNIRVFMYVMAVLGAITVNVSKQRTEYGVMINNLRLLAGWLLAGGLLCAAYMDLRHCWVYNYVWWWCIPWAGILGLTEGCGMHGMLAVLLFVMVQQFVFSKMYGRADCHAFSVCALAECGNGAGMVMFLVHMLLSVLLLATVQLFRGNIAPSGRLRTPRPFIPYIITAFYLTALIGKVLMKTYIYA